jgi:putative aldouronate transport system substrate-binding protein
MKRKLRLILSMAIVMAFVVNSLVFAAINVKVIKLNASNITLQVGKTYPLKVSFTPTNTTQKLLSYSTANKSVATVDKTGVIKGIKAGKTVVTVTSQSNKKLIAKCNVTIINLLKPVELNAYFLAPQLNDLNQVNVEVNKLVKNQINATVKLNYYDLASYEERQRLSLASGEPVDLMFTANWWNYFTYVSQKAYLQLDDLLEQYGPDIKANIHPAYLVGPRVDGKLFAIPTNKELGGWLGVLVNKAMAKKYKMDFSKVKSPKDYEPMLKTIKENEKDVVPFLCKMNEPTYVFMKRYFGELIYNTPVGIIDDGKNKPRIINFMEDKRYIDLVNLARNWYKKGYINQDVATLKDTNLLWKSQKAFMIPAFLKPGKAAEESIAQGYEVMQVNTYGPEDVKTEISVGGTTNSMLAIPRASKNPERAMMFLNLLFKDKKIKNLLSWGIEGKHYKKIKENQIAFADGIDAKTSGYTGIMQWAMGGNQMLDYLWENEDPEKWDQMKKLNDASKVGRMYGWTFTEDSVKTEIAAVTTATSQYKQAIDTGIVDYSVYYPQLKAAAEKAGIDKIIKEAQRQIDEFLAAKE